MAAPRRVPIDQEVVDASAAPRRGVVGRAVDRLRTTFFGPGVPIPPVAPPDTEPRRFDYPISFNTRVAARREGSQTEELSFQQLRQLADSCELIRLAIETRKAQIARLEWDIQAKDEDALDGDEPPEPKGIAEIRTRWQRPDGQRRWKRWVKMALEDLLVLDGIAIYKRPTRGGGVHGLELLDAATIKPLLDERGNEPLVGPAYQQFVKGLPAVEFTRDELLYEMLCERTNRVYGNSPVQQINLIANLAIRRSLWQIQTYTDGTIPEAIYQTPENWTTSMVREFQAYWDSLFEGDQAQKRRMRAIPGGPGASITWAKSDLLKDEIEEWLARVVAYAFSLPPTWAVKQMNRACYSSDTETLTERGWRRYPEIEPDEKIATYNPATRRIEYHLPLSRHVYPMDEEMVRFQTRGVDVLVTPEHKMWARGADAREYGKVPASEVRGQFRFLAAAEFEGEERQDFILPGRDERYSRAREPLSVSMDDWLTLLGYYLSEGGLSHTRGHYLFTLAQRPGEVADRIQGVLERLPFSFSRYPSLGEDGVQRWNVYGQQLCTWLARETGGYCSDKRIPRELLALAPRQLRLLFDAMMDGDGSWDPRENRTSGAYHTTSKQLADDVQELAFKLGYCAAVKLAIPAAGNRQDCYRVLISARAEHALRAEASERTPASITREPYDGYVYCFNVPNHLFVTRRNGKIAIHGNTAETAENASIEEGQLPLMTELADIFTDALERFEGRPDLCFVFRDPRKADPESQARVHDLYVRLGALSIDEVREDLGRKPIGMGHAVYTATGPVFIDDLKEGLAGPGAVPLLPDGTPAPPGLPAPGAPGAPGEDVEGQVVDEDGKPKPGVPSDAATVDAEDDPEAEGQAPSAADPKAAPSDDGEPGDDDADDQGDDLDDEDDDEEDDEDDETDPPKRRAQKAAGGRLTVRALSRHQARLRAGRARNDRTVKAAVRALAADIAAALRAQADAVAEAVAGHVAQADAGRLAKEAKADVDALLLALDLGALEVVRGTLEDALRRISTRGAQEAVAALSLAVPTAEAFELPNGALVDYARDRAAELVGKRVLPSGEVIDSPNPEIAITEGTRTLLRGTIATALEQAWSREELRDVLTSSYAFSERRAMTIARTELSRALVVGNVESWKASGVVAGKQWILGSLHDLDDECDGNAADGVVGIGETFSSGASEPPAHVNCVCDVLPILSDDGDA